MSAAAVFWDIVPYVTIAILVVGTWWRYRYDKFGWTTRSSQLYESRLLRIGSPLFHFGILLVFFGHVGGLVIPESWTEAVGVSEGLYHFNALLFGGIAGVCTLAGILILVFRRRTTGPVFMATTKNDKLMYVLLVAAIVLGLWTTLVSVGAGSEAHNYRETVSPWFRSVLLLSPDADERRPEAEDDGADEQDVHQLVVLRRRHEDRPGRAAPVDEDEDAGQRADP